MAVTEWRRRDHVVYDPGVGQWFVQAYDDVRALLGDERLTADRMHGFADRAPPAAVDAVKRHAPWLISPQGADYDWIRPIVAAGLRDSANEAARHVLRNAAHVLLDGLLRRERFDVVDGYALALSGWMVSDFLGVDRRDGQRLVDRGMDLVTFFNDAEITSAGCERMARGAGEIVACARRLLAETRVNSGAGFLHDVARAARARGRELDDEAMGNVTLPLVTGHVDLAHLIANTVWLLLDHDDQRARLASDPGLIAGAVSEALRYASPVALVPRITLEAMTLRGCRVGIGETVQLSLAAANRDPERFPDPDRFDIARTQDGALGFGHGMHACIAAGLTRSRAAIAVDALLDRAPDLAFDPDAGVVWRTTAGMQALKVLGVRVGMPRP